jgi:protein-S-isoprenylcysteine O-methyltransferase Ste14
VRTYALDPVAIYVAVVVLVIGPLLAAGYVWVDRRISRRTQTEKLRLTPIGNALLVVFVLALGVAVIFRQFYPDTIFGAWLRIEYAMPILVVGSLALLFAIEAFLKRLGVRTAKDADV